MGQAMVVKGAPQRLLAYPSSRAARSMLTWLASASAASAAANLFGALLESVVAPARVGLVGG
jgi:hypothetical protein